jgi:hypothetical protein
LEGAGFDIKCNDSIIPWKIGQGNFQNMMWLNVTEDPIEDSGTFTIDFATTNGTSNPDIKSDSCNTFLYEKHCTLRVAKVRYPMTLTNGTVSLARQLQADNQTIQMQSPSAEETVIGGTNPSTIGGILQAAADLWTSKSQGSITSAGMTTGFVGHAYNLKKNDLGECHAVWQDPTEDIFSGIRKMMFRSAITASASTSIQSARTRHKSLLADGVRESYGMVLCCSCCDVVEPTLLASPIHGVLEAWTVDKLEPCGDRKSVRSAVAGWLLWQRSGGWHAEGCRCKQGVVRRAHGRQCSR